MKKYFKTLISIAVVVALIQSCQKKDMPEKKRERIIHIPTSSETVETIPSQEAYETIAPVVHDDLYSYVNEEVYRNLCTARDQFNTMYSSGEVSSQMINHGTNVNGEDANYINSCMKNLYNLIQSYISAYESGNSEQCYQVAQTLYSVGCNDLNKGYLYRVIVQSKLPDGYKSAIEFDSYDGNDNLYLENGNRVHLIGGNDTLVSPSHYTNNSYSDMIYATEWISSLPSVLMSQYHDVESTYGNDGICYFWNETMVEKTCRREWEIVRRDGQSMYGLDPNTCRIVYLNDYNSYVYLDNDDQVIGTLDYANVDRVDHIYSVQDALTSKKGDVAYLDGSLREMYTTQINRGYRK